MARPQKTGLSYFPLDCDFLSDEKVIAVKVNCGAKGIAVMIALLCTIYRQGYYAQWNDMTAMKIANDLQQGVSPDAVNKVVELLVKYDFFDKGLFCSENILTSVAIQRRFFDITRRRRLGNDMPYLLVNVNNNSVNVNNNSVNVDNNATNKIKSNQTKQNKTTLEGVSLGAPPSAPAPTHGFSLDDVRALTGIKSIARFGPTDHDCEAFHAYYSARDWCIDAKPIASLPAAFTVWLKRRGAFKDDMAAVEAQRRRADRQRRDAAEEATPQTPAATPEQISALMARHGFKSQFAPDSNSPSNSTPI